MFTGLIREIGRLQGMRPGGVTRLDIARPRSFAYQPGDYVFLRASSDDSRLNGVEAAAVCTLNCMAPVQASIVERIVNELNSGNAVPELPDEIYALQSVVSNTCTALQNRSGTFAEVDAACEVLLGGTVCLADPKAIEYVTNPQKALDDAEALLRERLRADVYNLTGSGLEHTLSALELRERLGIPLSEAIAYCDVLLAECGNSIDNVIAVLESQRGAYKAAGKTSGASQQREEKQRARAAAAAHTARRLRHRQPRRRVRRVHAREHPRRLPVEVPRALRAEHEVDRALITSRGFRRPGHQQDAAGYRQHAHA